MGKYGWSREEQDLLRKDKIKIFTQKIPVVNTIERRAKQLLLKDNVRLVSAQKGYLTFEVKDLRKNIIYNVTRTNKGEWSAFHKPKEDFKGVLRQMEVIHNPKKSVPITACILWLSHS
jgi:hypothetical protein